MAMGISIKMPEPIRTQARKSHFLVGDLTKGSRVPAGKKKNASPSASQACKELGERQILGAWQAAYLVAVESYHGRLTGNPEVIQAHFQFLVCRPTN